MCYYCVKEILFSSAKDEMLTVQVSVPTFEKVRLIHLTSQDLDKGNQKPLLTGPVILSLLIENNENKQLIISLILEKTYVNGLSH